MPRGDVWKCSDGGLRIVVVGLRPLAAIHRDSVQFTGNKTPAKNGNPPWDERIILCEYKNMPTILSVSYRPLVLAVAAVAGIAVEASQLGFVAPEWRGTPGAEFQSWEIFRVATNDGVGNAPDQPGSTASATLTQLSPGAFITGAGNIYNPGGISSFVVKDTAPEPVGLVWFQARTLGSELDYGTVQLRYDLGGGTQFIMADRIETDRGTILGASVSSLWQWNVAGLGLTSYEIQFTAAGGNLSFDSAVLDSLPASAVPEPSTWALAFAGLAGLGLLVWRSRHE